MKALYKKHILNFIQASGTSRGVLKTKETYFLIVTKDNRHGIGECAVFRGLSYDDCPEYEHKLKWLCTNINLKPEQLYQELVDFPSILFGLEQALLSIKSENTFELFPSAFTQGDKGIEINGLIWMGDEAFMKSQISEKLKKGFTTIKMKIGAIDFNTEIKLLKNIRKNFSSKEVTLRVDANGAFDPQNALEKLKTLSELEIHSIEQPIKQGQFEDMARLCIESPVPIALDEELIGVLSVTSKKDMLRIIKPQYLILKPSLLGGFKASLEWIDLAAENNIGWWVTSALESNIGLNAIAQWTFLTGSTMPQGLGTGSLFSNNIMSPLDVESGFLKYNKDKKWQFDLLKMNT